MWEFQLPSIFVIFKLVSTYPNFAYSACASVLCASTCRPIRSMPCAHLRKGRLRTLPRAVCRPASGGDILPGVIFHRGVQERAERALTHRDQRNLGHGRKPRDGSGDSIPVRRHTRGGGAAGTGIDGRVPSLSAISWQNVAS